MTLPGGWCALVCGLWHQGGLAQHRDAGQRGLGAPIRGSSPAGKTEDQACADLPTARPYGSTRPRGHRGQSPRPVRLHSASTGCAPRGSLPDSPETDTYRALHRAHRGNGAYVSPRDTGPVAGEKQEAYQRGGPAVAHGGPRAPHPLRGTSLAPPAATGRGGTRPQPGPLLGWWYSTSGDGGGDQQSYCCKNSGLLAIENSVSPHAEHHQRGQPFSKKRFISGGCATCMHAIWQRSGLWRRCGASG